MANAWENPSMIAAEALMHLEDSLIITRLCATDKTADFLQRPNGYAVGETLKIKTRPEYEVNDFSSTITKQGIRSSTRSMTLEHLYDVSVEITAREKAMNLDSFSEEVIQPAIYTLAEKCDTYVGTKILKAAGLYPSDALFTTQADMAAARKAANLQQLMPGRICLIDSTLEATLLGANYFSTYNQRGDAGATAFNRGALGSAMGLDFYASLQFPEDVTATVGTLAGLTDNNSGANNKIGDSALVWDAATGTVVAGDRIYIAGVRRPLIAAGAVADASATLTVTLVDPITEVIPDNAAITVMGTTKTNLVARGVIMDKACLAYAMPMLDTPSDKPSSVVSSNGFSLRITQGYDMDTKKEIMSIDCLIGAEAYDTRRMTLLREY